MLLGLIADVDYKTRNVLTDPELRNAIKEYRFIAHIPFFIAHDVSEQVRLWYPTGS